MTDSTPLYKDCVTDINNGYRDLLRYYSVGDTRVGYLKAFELCLSQACPGKILWAFDEYVDQARIFPLSENPRDFVNGGVYYSYMKVYEQIMRKIGLLDKEPVDETPSGIFTFAMREDRCRT